MDKNSNQQKILSDDKVDVDIEPDVKSNNINIQMCYLSLVFNCCVPFNKNITNKDKNLTNKNLLNKNLSNKETQSENMLDR